MELPASQPPPLKTANQAPTLPLPSSPTKALGLPPPSTRPAPVVPPPHPTGHPSKSAIFLLKHDTLRWCPATEALAPQSLLRPWGPCPYHLPLPEPKPLDPPEPGQTLPHLPSGTEALGFPLKPLPPPVELPSKPTLPWTCPSLEQPTKPQLPFFGTAIQPLRPTQPSPATKALGLPPRPPGQLRWVPPAQPHRASFKKRHFSSFCIPPHPPGHHRASFKKRHFSSFCTR